MTIFKNENTVLLDHFSTVNDIWFFKLCLHETLFDFTSKYPFVQNVTITEINLIDTYLLDQVPFHFYVKARTHSSLKNIHYKYKLKITPKSLNLVLLGYDIPRNCSTFAASILISKDGEIKLSSLSIKNVCHIFRLFSMLHNTAKNISENKK